jgi:hypothetical protein
MGGHQASGETGLVAVYVSEGHSMAAVKIDTHYS